jgi:hypothetical protein
MSEATALKSLYEVILVEKLTIPLLNEKLLNPYNRVSPSI